MVLMTLHIESLYSTTGEVESELEVEEIHIIYESKWREPGRHFLAVKNGFGEVKIPLSEFQSVTYSDGNFSGKFRLSKIDDDVRTQLEQLFGVVFDHDNTPIMVARRSES